MKQYKVHKHPSGSIEAVKQGWSWPGFGFTFIWAMVKKMWGLGVGGLIVLAFLTGILSIASAAIGGSGDADVAAQLLGLIASIVFGIKGNSWREKKLASRGFEHVDTVSAVNPESAIALHLKGANAER